MLLGVILSRVQTDCAIAKGLHGDFDVICRFAEFDTSVMCALGVFCILSVYRQD